MSDIMPLTKTPIPISFRGVFDLEKIYKTTVNWMAANNLTFKEKFYKSKRRKGGGREIVLRVFGTSKIDEFHQWIVYFNIDAWDTFEVETIVKGQKKKMIRGRIVVSVEGEIVRDFQDVYENTPFKQKIRLLLLKVMGLEENIKIWDTYYYKTIKLQSIVRNIIFDDTANDIF